MKCGLLPISPEALSLGEVTYHDYHGIVVDEDEKAIIQKSLGPTSKVTAWSFVALKETQVLFSDLIFYVVSVL